MMLKPKAQPFSKGTRTAFIGHQGIPTRILSFEMMFFLKACDRFSAPR